MIDEITIERKDVNCILQDTNDMIMDLLSKGNSLVKVKTYFKINSWYSDIKYSDKKENTIDDFKVGDKVEVVDLKEELEHTELIDGYIGTITSIDANREIPIELNNTWSVYPYEIKIVEKEEIN